MPSCRECVWFNGESCISESKKDSRKCSNAVFRKHLPFIAGSVLEVGHGVSKGARYELEKRGVRWVGIDPRWPDQPENNHFYGTAAYIPFEDESFDWVLALDTMEHWEEDFHSGNSKPERPDDGLREIWRVLRPGGRLLITVPIHWHGTDMFYFGRTDKIVNLFKGWRIQIEEWRKLHHPLPIRRFWSEERNGLQRMRELVAELGYEPSSYTLEIMAEKA